MKIKKKTLVIIVVVIAALAFIIYGVPALSGGQAAISGAAANLPTMVGGC